MISRDVPVWYPGLNPTATLAGTPIDRSSTANAEEYCSQYPVRPSNRKSARASEPLPVSVSRLYWKPFAGSRKKAVSALALSIGAAWGAASRSASALTSGVTPSSRRYTGSTFCGSGAVRSSSSGYSGTTASTV